MNDETLRRLLDEAAPSARDGAVALEASRESLTRARRRHRQRLGAGITVMALLAVIGLSALLDRETPSEIEFRDDGGIQDPPVTTGPVANDADESHTTSGADAAGDDEATADGSMNGPEANPAPASTSTSIPEPTTTTAAASSSTTTTAPTGPSTSTLGTAGGIATVTLQDGLITGVDGDPTVGWTVDTELESPREGRVEFEMGERKVRVDYEIEDGCLRWTVEDDGPDPDPEEVHGGGC